jgi:predicted kinase
VAVATSSDLVELHCVTTPEEADRRIVRRLAGHADISEATPEVREALARSMDPWASATVVDTTGRTPTEVVAVAEAILDPRRSG